MLKFKTPEEAFVYIESFINFEKTRKQTIRDYRLSRMEALLSHFGDPHKGIKLIHIAGSKGKGSTGVLTASGLDALGYKTGLYTSPHVSSYRERITLAGRFFSSREYIKAAEEIAGNLGSFSVSDETGSTEPTTFELLTLMAFIMFRNADCSWAVIETGIGGRLDATNVIDPEAVIITPIEKEHTDILGNTLKDIASEKAGIIKKGKPVFSAVQKPEAEQILKEKAAFEETSVTGINDVFEIITSTQTGKINNVKLINKNGTEIVLKLKLPGSIQSQNAALAFLSLSILFSSSSADFIKKISGGFEKASLPGRFEIIEKETTYIFDGAHTPESVRHTVETFKKIFTKGGIVIFGAVDGKDYRGMAEVLSPCFDKIIISTPGTFKENHPQEVFDVFKSFRQDILFYPEPEKALINAQEIISRRQAKGSVLVTGSFYMVSEIRSLVVQENDKG